MDFLLSAFYGATGLLQLALMAGAIIDIIRRERPWAWALLVLLLPCLGSLIYFANFYLFDSIGWRRLDAGLSRSRRIRQLQQLSKVQDTAGLHLELGELLHDKGDYPAAARALQRALDIDGELLRAHYFAGRSLLELGKPEGAVAHLEFVTGEDPRYLYGEGLIALGRAYEAAGRGDDAFAAYGRALEVTSIAEAVYRHAMMLRARGDEGRARENLERLVRESSAVPHFKPARDRPWIRAAKRALRG